MVGAMAELAWVMPWPEGAGQGERVAARGGAMTTAGNNEGGRVPDLLVEKLALGELDRERADQVRARLAREPGGLARLEALAASNEDILRRMPPALVAAQVDARVAAAKQGAPVSRPRGLRWLTLAGPGLVIAAAALFVVVRGQAPDAGSLGDERGLPGIDEHIRLKGLDAHLVVYVPTEDGAGVRISHGDVLREGDEVQLGVVPVRASHAAVLSIDGRGVVTWHLPRQPAKHAVRVAPDDGAREVRLDASYVLDDAPGFERFFLVTSDQAFGLREVDDAAHALARDLRDAEAGELALRSGLEVHTFKVGKPGTRAGQTGGGL